MNRRRRGNLAPDSGTAAVEFALLLPLLLLILFGIIDFGRAFNSQITLTQAAREGARLAALGDSNTQVGQRVADSAVGLNLSPTANVTVTDYPGTPQYACPKSASVGGSDAQVTVSYSFSFVTPVGALMGMFGGSGFGSPITLSATGVMPCEQ